MLHHFFVHHLAPEVKTLELFFDGCSGQNKNYTLLRFLHMLVHKEKRVQNIRLRFPIRGHSYMYLECDRDLALVNQKADIDLPHQWHQVIESARVKPSPYSVISCKQDMFKTSA
ncbi:envelope glycoprotein D [Elysia marginata]|uniref:Envelope glycoprotein D n=1 Tax=Elysia marginata TaxID=1093978 RepID=A0AAV4FGE5_9GAST|nr:envelope glycoprotein D [Elysia marginata]